jgi:hypothetical protein
MFKLLPRFSRSLPLSQILLSISCLLTTSAIASPIPTSSLDRVNASQDPPISSDLHAREVPGSIAFNESTDPVLNFQEFLEESLVETLVVRNPYPPCLTSTSTTSTTSTNESTTSHPLTTEGETTENSPPPVLCVAHLTNVPISLESLKTDSNLTTPAPASAATNPIAQENTQDNPTTSPPEQSPSIAVKLTDDSNRWHFQLQPYLIAPISTYGSVAIRNRSIDYNLSLGEVLSSLNFAIYGRFEAWNNNLGFIADASYLKLGNVASASRRQTTLSATTSFSQGVYDFAVSYHFGDPAQYSLPDKPSNKSFPLYWFEPILGVRLNSLDASIDASLDFGRFDRNFQRTISRGRTWLEPMIGAKFGVQVSDPLILWLRGDVSGFGLAGNPDLSWNVIAGADLWISPTTSLQLAYRFYEINYGNNELRFKSGYNGLFLGTTFNF